MGSLVHVFASRRMLLVLLLGFSSGLPLSLTNTTLQAWMKDANVDLTTIGVFALVGLPYTLKFLWSPLMDSYVPPVLGRLGRRRGWGLLTQACLLVAIAAMAFANPSQAPGGLAALALVVAFFSASQDIVLDALRTEILHKDEMGAGAGVYVMGYRLAMLASGAGALILADHLPWRVVYLAMAAMMAIGMATTLATPEPAVEIKPVGTLRERVALPFVDFFKRSGAVEILLFVMTYKLSTMMATSLTTVFLMDLSFSKTEIGAVTKVYGLIATIVGTLAGGALMTKLGTKRSLWVFGLLQSLAGLSFLLLAELGHNSLAMMLVISVENFMIGLGVAAISGFMMQICKAQFTATQFALLSSLTAVSRVVLVAPAGALAQKLGWPGFYLFSTLLGIPGLLLLLRYDTWSEAAEGESSARQLGAWDLALPALFLASLVVISIGKLPEALTGAGLTPAWVGGVGVGASMLGWALRRRSQRAARVAQARGADRSQAGPVRPRYE